MSVTSAVAIDNEFYSHECYKNWDIVVERVSARRFRGTISRDGHILWTRHNLCCGDNEDKNLADSMDLLVFAAKRKILDEDWQEYARECLVGGPDFPIFAWVFHPWATLICPA